MVLLLNVVATIYMTGVIWLVQIVHYPLFGAVGAAEFAAYEARHRRRIVPVVLPMMALELITAAWLALHGVPGVDGRWFAVGFLLCLLLAASTFLVQMPLHQRLERNFDPVAMRALIVTNWVRTSLWTIRTILVSWILHGLLPPSG
jgi:hypothetical protein